MSLQSLVFLCRHLIDWSQWSESEIWSWLQGSVHLRSWNLDQSSAAALYWQEFMSSPFRVLQRLCWLGLHNLNLLPGHQWTSSSLFTAALWITTLLEENDDQMMPIHLVNLESALSYMTIYCVKGPDFESDFKFWIESTCTKISIQHENWSMENCLSRNLDVQAQIRFWVCLKSVHTERSAQDQYILPAVPDSHTGQQ